MGLTKNSTGLNILREEFNLDLESKNPIIALAGNPNTGKSTVFNSLTGLKQHTGNWPGKTVTRAQGYYRYQDREYTLIDLPGTYSLLANSTEERIARDFICFARPDATIVVVDATNLERNLNLVLQVTELTDNVVLCLNLMDEARKKNIKINVRGLENGLQIPLVPTVARDGIGLDKLKDVVHKIITGTLQVKPAKVQYSPEVETAIAKIMPLLKLYYSDIEDIIDLRWLALRLLEGDTTILKSIETYFSVNSLEITNIQKEREVQADGVA